MRGLLRGRGRTVVRAVIVLLSLHGLSPAQIAVPVEYDPATVRRRIGLFHACGVTGLADRPRSGRPRLAAGDCPRGPPRCSNGQLLATATPWTSPWFPPGYRQNFRKRASAARTAPRGVTAGMM
ncbi:hypothetical protein HEK616_81900 (plasmid) [Streptomyces nigrescens]|uniref:Transposase n=1 Tax=Streptomyces nigrescens TaxID=1920 RepID=A0ABM8A7M1_STRNI|nr:hypothetical protein HEK616_81900 [Streptomyces nigrescens]